MTCDEFLLRLAQYWAVICATRTDRMQRKDPANQKTTTVILRLYRSREKISRGLIDGVEYASEISTLRIHGKGFERTLGRDMARPFKLFARDEPFVRSVKTFARSATLSEWRTDRAPTLDRVERLLERFRKEAGVDLSDDLQYVGVLVATKPRDGEAIIAFEPLNVAQSRAYGLDLIKRFEAVRLPAELPVVTGCVVIKTGNLPALRTALGISDIRVVLHPAVEASRRDLEESASRLRHIRISGRTGTGKTSLLYHMAGNAETGLVLVLTRRATPAAIAAFLGGGEVVTVVCDDAHLLPPSLVSTIVGFNNVSLLSTCSSTDEGSARMNNPELFAADVAPISLDAVDASFLREVTRSIANELKVGMTERRLDAFVSHVGGWDATPGGIKHYLQDFAGREWSEPGFWLRDDRHAPWSNKFQLLNDRDQMVLRLIAAMVTLTLPVVSYHTLRKLFVDYCGRNAADFDAAIISLRSAGWYDIEEPMPGSEYARIGERHLRTDWVRIPPKAFGITGLFLENLAAWSREHGIFTDDIEPGRAV